ncbi:type I restriction enzyme S subunit [Salinibacter ruber]|nr:type I restriction enzyme S subunit [Salinibacter ruber]
MEVVEDDELDELGADGASSSEETVRSDAGNPEKGYSSDRRAQNQDSTTTQKGPIPSNPSNKEDGEARRFGPFTLDVPEEWRAERQGKVKQLFTRGKQPTYAEDGVPVINQECIYWNDWHFGNLRFLDREEAKDWPEKYFPKKDDIILNSTGQGTLGRAQVYPDEERRAVDSHVTILRTTDDLNPYFHRYFLESNLGQALLYSMCVNGSTGQIELSKTRLDLMPVPIPPLPEQRKIASVLYAVDQAIQKTEAIIEQAEKIRDGVINGLFEIDGVEKVSSPDYNSPRFQSILSRREETWEESERERWEAAGEKRSIDSTKYTSPLGLGKKRLPELPDDWEWVPLDLFVAYDIDYRGKTPPYSDAGVPVISSGNLQEGKVVFEDPRYVSPSTYDEWLDRGVPREGDLIVTTEAPVGKVALYPEGKYLPTRRIIVLRTVGVDNRYLKAAMNHPAVQNYLATQSRGTTVPRILKDYLLRTPIPFPPQKEHDQITEVLKHLDAKLGKERSAQSRLKRLKTGLMQDLLTGKVRTADKAIDVLDEVVEHG